MIPGRRTVEGQLVITAGPPLSTDPRMAGFAMKPTGEIYASGGQSAFTPADLFLNGEQGVWYDPSDLSTMFQDREGATPVTADGQPVGLILDKSKGLVLGSELVTNGDFSNGSTGWAITETSGSWSISGGLLSSSAPAGVVGNIGCAGAVPTTVGVTVKVVIVVTAKTSTQVYYRLGGAAANYVQLPGTTGTIIFYAKVEGNTGMFELRKGDTAAAITIDSVSVKEILGNHASQSTAAKRPLYKTDGTYHWLQFDGVDDSLSTEAIDFTATDKMSVFSGVRKTSDVAVANIVELSTNSIAVAGTFMVQAPGTAGAPRYLSYLHGVSGGAFYEPATFTAPIKNTVLTMFDLSASTRATAVKPYVNGTLTQTNPAGTDSGGGGNFMNNNLYIGSRGLNTWFLNGNIYSLITRGASSTADEITETETWVNGKTGAY